MDCLKAEIRVFVRECEVLDNNSLLVRCRFCDKSRRVTRTCFSNFWKHLKHSHPEQISNTTVGMNHLQAVKQRKLQQEAQQLLQVVQDRVFNGGIGALPLVNCSSSGSTSVNDSAGEEATDLRIKARSKSLDRSPTTGVVSMDDVNVDWDTVNNRTADDSGTVSSPVDSGEAGNEVIVPKQASSADASKRLLLQFATKKILSRAVDTIMKNQSRSSMPNISTNGAFGGPNDVKQNGGGGMPFNLPTSLSGGNGSQPNLAALTALMQSNPQLLASMMPQLAAPPAQSANSAAAMAMFGPSTSQSQSQHHQQQQQQQQSPFANLPPNMLAALGLSNMPGLPQNLGLPTPHSQHHAQQPQQQPAQQQHGQFMAPKPPIQNGSTSSASSVAGPQKATLAISSCERILEEFSQMHQQLLGAKQEYEKLAHEKQELHKQYQMYYEMSYSLNVDMYKQTEIARRYREIINNFIPTLPAAQQQHLLSEVERAKVISQSELQQIITHQINQALKGDNPAAPPPAPKMASQSQTLNVNNGGAVPNANEAQLNANINQLLQSLAGNPDNLKELMSLLTGSMANVLPASMKQQLAAMLNMPLSPSSASASSSSRPDEHNGPTAARPTGNDVKMTSPSAASDQSTSALFQLASIAANSASMPTANSLKRPRQQQDDDAASTCSSTAGETKRSKQRAPSRAQSVDNDRRKSKSNANDNSMSAGSAKSTDGAAANNKGRDGAGDMRSSSALPQLGLPGAVGSNAFPLPPSLDLHGLANGSVPTAFGDLSQVIRALNPAAAAAAPANPTTAISTEKVYSFTSTATRQAAGKTGYAVDDWDWCPWEPTNFPPEPAVGGTHLPRESRHLSTLQHGEVVCAVAIDRLSAGDDKYRVFTGGQGCVKLWDVNGGDAVDTLMCTDRQQFIRSIRMLSDRNSLVVSGESCKIAVFDLATSKLTTDLSFDAPACYALALSKDDRLMFSCAADGKVLVWDMASLKVVREFVGHVDGASCIDLARDQRTAWTGGLDCTLRQWDIGTGKEMENSCSKFDSQIFSLGCSPTEDYLAVGLESSLVEVLSLNDGKRLMPPSAVAISDVPSATSTPTPMFNGTSSTSSSVGAAAPCPTPFGCSRYRLRMHDLSVLSLRFASTGAWFVSTGKDFLLNACRAPYGNNLFQTREMYSILSCDISADDKYIVTGSGGKKATVYELVY